MSNYFSQYVPDQIKNMVSKIKEVTIDMGPLPVKFAKFSSISKDSLLKLLPNDLFEV